MLAKDLWWRRKLSVNLVQPIWEWTKSPVRVLYQPTNGNLLVQSGGNIVKTPWKVVCGPKRAGQPFWRDLLSYPCLFRPLQPNLAISEGRVNFYCPSVPSLKRPTLFNADLAQLEEAAWPLNSAKSWCLAPVLAAAASDVLCPYWATWHEFSPSLNFIHNRPGAITSSCDLWCWSVKYENRWALSNDAASSSDVVGSKSLFMSPTFFDISRSGLPKHISSWF